MIGEREKVIGKESLRSFSSLDLHGPSDVVYKIVSIPRYGHLLYYLHENDEKTDDVGRKKVKDDRWKNKNKMNDDGWNEEKDRWMVTEGMRTMRFKNGKKLVRKLVIDFSVNFTQQDINEGRISYR